MNQMVELAYEVLIETPNVIHSVVKSNGNLKKLKYVEKNNEIPNILKLLDSGDFIIEEWDLGGLVPSITIHYNMTDDDLTTGDVYIIHTTKTLRVYKQAAN